MNDSNNRFDTCSETYYLCLNASKENIDNTKILTFSCCGIKTTMKDESIFIVEGGGKGHIYGK